MTLSESPGLIELRPIDWESVEAITQHQRLDGWAEDFPAQGDVVIAGVLQRAGADHLDATWGHYRIVESETQLVVGGVGFFGPPHAGQTEIGYGVVPSRCGRGYATQAVQALCELAWIHGAEELTAETDLDNPASQRVLEKAGFELQMKDAQRTYSRRKS